MGANPSCNKTHQMEPTQSFGWLGLLPENNLKYYVLINSLECKAYKLKCVDIGRSVFECLF